MRPILRDTGLAMLLALPFWLGLAWLASPLPDSHAARHTLMFWWTMVVFSPILEEWCFRGGVLGWLGSISALKRDWHGLTLANALSSALFAVVHAWAHPWYWAAGVFPVSLVLGVLFEKHQRLWVVMWLHAWYNAGYWGVLVTR